MSVKSHMLCLRDECVSIPETLRNDFATLDINQDGVVIYGSNGMSTQPVDISTDAFNNEQNVARALKLEHLIKANPVFFHSIQSTENVVDFIAFDGDSKNYWDIFREVMKQMLDIWRSMGFEISNEWLLTKFSIRFEPEIVQIDDHTVGNGRFDEETNSIVLYGKMSEEEFK